MPAKTILSFIKQLHRPIFTTHEISAFSGKSLSTSTQSLNLLEKQGLVFKIRRGIWAEAGNERLSPYRVMPFLLHRARAYVSFLSALHLYGIIEQIPQAITLASIMHTRIIKTKIGVFYVHQLSPEFFAGFGWYKGTGSFLIAEPEKALIDCLYLSARRKKQFSHFPELHFPKSFSFKKAGQWVKAIPDYRIRAYVQKKLDLLKKAYSLKLTAYT